MSFLPTLALILFPFLQAEAGKAKQGEPKKADPKPAAHAEQEKEKTTVEGGVLTFKVKTLDGKEVSNESLKGKVALVDIWGTWCPPCRKAVPALVKLSEELAKKDVVVLGVAFEVAEKDKDKKPMEFDPAKASSTVKAFAEEQKISYALALGGQRAQGDVEKVFPTLKGFRGYPTLVLIGRDGKVREVEVGYMEEKFAKLADVVRKAAEEPAPKAHAGKSH